MISSTAYALTALFLSATVSAHGNITVPAARRPGPGMVQACGQAAVESVLADETIPLEDVLNVTSTCRLDLCRGAVFADNIANVQVFQAGQVVNMQALLPIPHFGPANVSIVSVASNRVLGQPLIFFDVYADERLAELPPNNTNFDITIPAALAKSAACRIAGECVLQWFWFGTDAKQTYESCVDFVIGAPAVAPGRNSTFKAGVIPPQAIVPSVAASVAAPVAAATPAVASAPAAPLASSVPDVAAVPQVAEGAIPAKVDATPLAVQPEGVVGGVVGTIAIEDAAPLKRRAKTEMRLKLAKDAILE